MSNDTASNPKVARYFVIMERQLGEQDYAEGHDGSADGAMRQLARELQECYDGDGGGAPDGLFRVVGREVVDGFMGHDDSAFPLHAYQWPKQGDPA